MIIQNAGGSIKSFQTGVTSLGVSGTVVNVPITAVDLSRTFVVVMPGAVASADSPGKLAVSGRLTSTTNLQLSRNVSGFDVKARWQIIEFSGNIKVQQVIATMSGVAVLDVVITAVDLSKTFLIMSWESNSTTNTAVAFGGVMPNVALTTATNLRLSRDTTGGSTDVVTFVVECQ